MGFFDKIFGSRRKGVLRPQRLDYLNEGLALERQGDYDAALTSYRLALRDNPSDTRVLQNIAIVYTKTQQVEEAIRFYRRSLEVDHELGGAHYGLAFLLIKRGDPDSAVKHLKAFLDAPPLGPDAQQWVAHAKETLQEICEKEESSQP
jgi:tetratricopeptide (TPR) repeat protein